MRMTQKIFTWAGTNLFFLGISGDILFASLVSFAFFVFLFFLLVCLFLEMRNIHSDTRSTMRAGEIFIWPISGNKTTLFFGLTIILLQFRPLSEKKVLFFPKIFYCH